nr:lipopolysaccharide biosynthesis protein [uncultured Sediminibacterium sp.]
MHPNDEFTLKDVIQKIRSIIRFLLSKWKLFMVIGFLGGVVGGFYAQLQKPVYVATLSFALEGEKGGGGLKGALGIASSLGFDLGGSAGGAFEGSNLVELIKSRKLIEQTLLRPVKMDSKEESLAEYFIKIKGWREGWEKENGRINSILKFPPYSDRSNFVLEQDSVLGKIYTSILSTLTVGPKDKKSTIMGVSFKFVNPLFAKTFVEALIDEVSSFYVDTKSKKAKINLEVLERQTDSVRRELNAAIGGVASATDNTYNLNPALNIMRAPSQRRQVDVQANTAILTELVKNLELARITLRQETPLIQVVDTPILPLPMTKMGRLKTAITLSILLVLLTAILLLVRSWWNTVNSND